MIVDIGISKKTERADKLISDDITNILYDFPDVDTTSIGIITSDCDFTNDLKRVKDRGFKSILILRKNEGSASTLSSFATKCIYWEDILKKLSHLETTRLNAKESNNNSMKKNKRRELQQNHGRKDRQHSTKLEYINLVPEKITQPQQQQTNTLGATTNIIEKGREKRGEWSYI